MLDRLKDRFIFETSLTIHIVRRDRLRRCSILPILFCILWFLCSPRVAVIMILTISATETAAWGVGFGQRIDGPSPGLVRGALAWVVACLSTVAYLWCGILIGQLDSLAMQVSSCIFLFGALVMISNAFVAVPLYNWSMIVPAYLILIFNIYQIFVHPGAIQNQMEAYILGGLLLIYFANTVETTQKYKDTLSALDGMRELANRRMAELEKLSLCDALTGLPNRLAFDPAAQACFERGWLGKSGGGAIFLIDLDGFKPINDSYSHAVGDALLKEVAVRLTRGLPGACILARLGADEFALAWAGSMGPADMARVASDINTLIRAPFVHQHLTLQIAASIGIAPARPGASIDLLLNEADQALQKAKKSLETPVIVFDVASFPRRLTLDDRAQLITAIRRNEFQPYYQPQVAVETGLIVGLEALVRWVTPQGEVRSPGTFLPAINELGLQADFQQHILDAVLQDMMAMNAEGLLPEQVSVNLAEVTLATQSGRKALISAIAKHPDLRPHLTFEVTEDIFIAHTGRMIQDSISLLRLAGARISLDDFGTGFASFQHLQELEFDELKLDTGFIRKLGQDHATDVLVKSFLDMGRGLDVAIVAEGVETQQQLDILRQMGCPIVQGYLFSPAIAFADITKMLRAERETVAA